MSNLSPSSIQSERIFKRNDVKLKHKTLVLKKSVFTHFCLDLKDLFLLTSSLKQFIPTPIFMVSLYFLTLSGRFSNYQLQNIVECLTCYYKICVYILNVPSLQNLNDMFNNINNNIYSITQTMYLHPNQQIHLYANSQNVEIISICCLGIMHEHMESSTLM